MAALEIGAAGEAGFAALLGIWRERSRQLEESGRKMWESAQFTQAGIRVKYGDPEIFAARVSGRVAGGFLLLETDPRRWPDRAGEKAFYIHKLVLHPDFSGQGYGAAMLEWIKDYAARAGKDWLRLDYEEGRPYLARLYAAAGFAVVEPALEEGAWRLFRAECRIQGR